MHMSGNTILITGGGSGIGRALAEAFNAAGNTVIISGRRREKLDEVIAANPGIEGFTLDIEDPSEIRSFAEKVVARFPGLNAVLHNAGIMQPEKVVDGDTQAAESIIATNLLGPIRLNAALLPTLLKQPHAAILTVSSGLAYTPLAMTPTYCATKAAIHSWTLSLRYQLRDSNVQVIELVPPYVQTELMGAQQAADNRAMPLSDFIHETMAILRDQPEVKEVLVERAKPLRFAEKGDFDAFFTHLNEQMAGDHS